MKTQKSREAGSTLLVVMLLLGIILLALGTYLALASQESRTMKRSLCWNAALPMAEAGIEEALSQLKQNTTNFAADGWTTNHIKHRSLTNGYYIVSFSGRSGGTVTILSTGSVHFADNIYISRTVRVTALTSKDFKFPGLMASSIVLSGDLNADSYDSTDPLASTSGFYDPAKAGASVLIGTTGSGFAMKGNSHVKGYVAAGPGGVVTASGSASVGDMNWNRNGIQPGHFTNNFTMSTPSVVAPFNWADPPVSDVVNGTSYDYVLEGGDYMAVDLNSSAYQGTMYVAESSTLYVTGTIDLTRIVFAPGVHLDLYVGGSTISFAPVVVGATAPDFTVFALPSCSSFSLNNGTIFTGLIYAPDTALAANGHAQISGAIVGKSFNCNGTFDFHYDLAFNKPKKQPPVKVLSWAEL
jgi:Tfp pilus assembly protein PilV